MQDTSSLSRRLAFFRIDQETQRTLSQIWPTIETNLPEILSRFYAHVGSTSPLGEFVAGQVEHLKAAQAKHWALMFRSGFNEDYVMQVERIGRAHERIGLSSDWYIGGYTYLLNELNAVLLRKFRFSRSKLKTAMEAIQKAVMLDMAYSINAYETVYREERERRSSQLEEAIHSFETGIADILKDVEAKGKRVETCTKQLTEAAHRSETSAASASTSANETARSVQSGAAAVEEMSTNVGEISTQVSRSAETARLVSEDADRANETVLGLQTATNEIGAVTELISAIAEQTNLLALNATIEAARAGEAGKGFAVVASEVKDLASQTSKATDEIAQKINAIQAETRRCVEEISAITEKIEDVSKAASSIASSVEQQGAATNEISMNIQSASQHASGITDEISHILSNATNANSAARTAQQAAEELHRNNEAIAAAVEQFFKDIRAA
ncbi:globin-coupled sensor protein [Pseudovibrio exalbescens]|uniref:globin-coupled sensor protein n=1 Tax=Pseudovibrio exalbescens TaxID=197461 RepID=UPI002365C89B|nr:globin-coupled sensor protein [Pseudovibrio exalbescens]MDD7910246.1 globin-coupled sensor protein [Pseudovibrio exalbescens]